MAKFKLKAGQHIQADKSRPVKDAKGEPTGRYETQVFTANERTKTFPVVESDTDLVARHGDAKFERLDGDVEAAHDEIRDLRRRLAEAEAQLVTQGGTFRVPGDPSDENLLRSPSVAPGGQVSTGFQATVAGESTGGLNPHATEGREPDFDSMDAKKLRAYAEENEIELHGARSKEDLLAAVKKGR